MWALRGDDNSLRLAMRGDPPRFLRASTTRIDEGDRLAAIMLRFRDETDLVEASKLVSEQAATLEAILSSMDEALCVTDAEHRVRYVNERFQRMGDRKNQRGSGGRERSL